MLGEFLSRGLSKISPHESRGVLRVMLYALSKKNHVNGKGRTIGLNFPADGGASSASHGRIAGAGGTPPARRGVIRGEVFEEWCISVVVDDSGAQRASDAVSEEERRRKDQETTQAVRSRVLFIVKEAAASETKLPDRIDGYAPFSYDLTLEFRGRNSSPNSKTESAISRGYNGLKSIARSFFG